MGHDFENNAFGSDPFADFDDGGTSPSKSSRSRKGTGRSRSSDGHDTGYGDAESAPRSSRGTRARRRTSLSTPSNRDQGSGELVLPGEGRSSRREVGRNPSSGSRSVVSTDSKASSGGGRPRRGRRASLVGASSASSSHDLGLSGTSGHSTDPDYGYGDANPSEDQDYGYGDAAPSSAAPAPVPGRRRGRRMSVGGYAPPPPQPEVDYGYSESNAPSYDEKFKTKSKDEEPTGNGARPRVQRSRSIRLDIQDIKNGEMQKDRQASSSRQLGGAPRPANNMAAPMIVPDVQKGRPRRRASMLGAVGGAVGGVAGAVANVTAGAAGAIGVGKGSHLEDEDGRKKGRRKGKSVEPEDGPKPSRMGTERRRQGTMLERFA